MSLYKKDVVEMHQNVNTLAKNKYVTAALNKAVMENNFMKYPDFKGFDELRELILEDLDLEGQEIIITAGATPGIEVTFRTLIEEPFHEVMTADPGYLTIDDMARKFGVVNSVSIWDKPYKLTPELIVDNIHDDTKFLVLIDPVNPSGAHYTKEELTRIAVLAELYDFIVIHDVTYAGFDEDHFSIAKLIPDRTVTLYSMSKVFGMAGMRIGALVTNKEMMDKIWPNVIDMLGVNAIGQEAAIAALKHKDKYIDEVKRRTRYSHKILCEKLEEIPGIKVINKEHNRASMMIVDISETGIDPDELDEQLKQRNIYVRAGPFTSKYNGHKYIRVSFSVEITTVYEFVENFKEVVNMMRTMLIPKPLYATKTM